MPSSLKAGSLKVNALYLYTVQSGFTSQTLFPSCNQRRHRTEVKLVNMTSAQTHSVRELGRGITQVQWNARLRPAMLSNGSAGVAQCYVRFVGLPGT